MRRVWFGVFLMAWVNVAALLSYAPIAQASISNQQGDIFVTLTPPRTDVTVVANRQGPGNPQQVSLHFNSANNDWESGDIPATQNGSAGCAQTSELMFTVQVSDATGVIKSQPDVYAGCGNQAKISLPVPSATQVTGSQNGGITGRLGALDSTTNKLVYSNNLSIQMQSLTGGSPDGKFNKTFGQIVDANGNYTIPLVPGIPPGVYLFTAKGAYSAPGGGADHFLINIAGTAVITSKTMDTLNLAQDANGQTLPMADIVSRLAAPASTPPPVPTSTTPIAVDCDAGPAFTWIVCGIIHSLVDVVNGIRDKIIVPFLKEPAFDRSQPQFAAAYAIWSAFRNVASVFFILVFFMIIIGTAAGFDNYTIKKVLPHLIAGAILMPFSWYICAIVIDIGNVLGQGLVSLISSVVPTPKIDLTSDFSSIFFGTATGIAVFAVTTVLLATMGLTMIISLAIAFAGVFLTLIMRKILILLCVVISPFALLAWILPNTEKWFKLWWQNFFKLVMVYPIVMMLFEAGRLFSATAGAAPGADVGFTAPVLSIVGLTLPLFLVPFAFKFAGTGLKMSSNAISKVQGTADKQFGKNSDFAKQLQEGRVRKNVNAAKIAESKAKSATGLHKSTLEKKAAMNWRRAGLSGSTGSAKLRRSDAYGKSMTELGTIGAEARQTAEGNPEDPRQRLASTTQSILDRKSQERGARQGVLAGYEQSGRPAASLLQSQAMINSRDNYIAGSGSAAGDIESDRLNEAERRARSGQYVSGSMKLQAATDTSALSASDKLGKVRGQVQGGEAAEALIQAQLSGAGRPSSAIDARNARLRNVNASASNLAGQATVKTQQDANTNVATNAELDSQVRAAAGGVISLQAARQLRLRNLSASTDTKGREQIALEEADINARNEISTTAGRESISNLTTAGRLAARDQIATARGSRNARTTLQATPDGYVSSSDTMLAANIEGVEHLATSVGAKQQLIKQEHADEQRATLDGNPNLRPTANNLVIAAQQQAKLKTANESAQRMAAVGAVRDGTATTTQQQTDAALYKADLDTTNANASALGVGGTVNTQVDDRARELIAASGGTLSRLDAHQQAVAQVRSRNLTAAGTVAKGAAENNTMEQIETAIGSSDTNTKQITDEVTALQASRVAAGLPALSPAAALAQATEEVRRTRLGAISDTARSEGSIKASEQAQSVLGAQQGLNSQIAEESARLQTTGMTPADAVRQATENIRNKNIGAAGVAARQKGASTTRRANDANIGVENNLNEAIDAEMASSGNPSRLAAESAVRSRQLSAAGATARSQAERKARKETGADLGVESDLNAEIDREMISSGTTDRDAATNAVRSRNLRALGSDAATKAARTNRLEVDTARGSAEATAAAVQTEVDKQSAEQLALYKKLGVTDGAVKVAANQSKIRADAESKVFAQTQNDAGDAARIGAQDAQAQQTGKDTGTVIENKANLKQAPVEAARNNATKTEYDRLQKATYDSAFSDAQRRGLTNADAAVEAEKAREDNKTLANQKAEEMGELAREAAQARSDAGQYSSKEQQQAKLEGVKAAAQEQAVRAEATTQAGIIGLNQAAMAPNALDANERLAVQSTTAIANLANESGTARSRYELTRPGASLAQSYSSAEGAAARTASSSINLARTKEAGFEEMTVVLRDYKQEGAPPLLDDNGNVQVVTDRINGIDVDPKHIPDMARQAREYLGWKLDPVTNEWKEAGPPTKPDKALAIMSRLSVTSSGREAVRQMQYDMFGRTSSETIDPKKFDGHARELWEVVQAANDVNSRPDFFMPQGAAYDGFSTSQFARAGWGEKRDYFRFLNSIETEKNGVPDPEGIEFKNQRLDEAGRNIQYAITNAQVAKDLSSDDYQQMWIYLQDPEALKALAARDPNGAKDKKGTDVIRKIYEEGNKAGAAAKWRRPGQGGAGKPDLLADWIRTHP